MEPFSSVPWRFHFSGVNCIYKIAKKISKELRLLIRSGKSYIKDTEQFVDKIRNIKLKEDETMISFDISDMYPSLPKQDVITEVVRRIKS